MSMQRASNTVPLVEPDGFGGHVQYVRQDLSPPLGSPVLPATAQPGQTTLVADREVLAALATLTELMREFVMLFVQHTGP